MKLHLPIGLRKALMAVFAVLTTAPAMAAVITEDATYRNGLTMSGDSNEISAADWTASIPIGLNIFDPKNWVSVPVPGYVWGGTEPEVKVYNGDFSMIASGGYNAIVGSLSANHPTVIVEKNKVVMNGSANAVMLGSSVTGTDITMVNTGGEIIDVETVAKGILGDSFSNFVPSKLGGIAGNFNIVQGSTLNATTGSVTLNASTANVITGGHGDVRDLVEEIIISKVGEDKSWAAKVVSWIADKFVVADDFGSSITAKQDITLSGGASVIVDTTLSDLVEFAKDQSNFNALLSGAKGNTTTTLSAGGSLVLDSVVNFAYGANQVHLKADSDILAGGALNVFGGNTKLEANNIKLTPYRSTSLNHMASELKSQLGGFLPFDLSSITSDLGALAKQDVNASIVAGGANLKATALKNPEAGQDAGGDISLGGTAGIVVNTKVTDILNAAMNHLATDDPHKMLFAKDVLMSGTKTYLEADRDINMGAQLNVLHGGGFTKTEGENTLTITAGRDVTLHGAANLVSGNVVVNANGKDAAGNHGDIHMQGYPLNNQLAGAAAGFANGLLKDMDIDNAGVSGMIGKLAEKGSFNVVTGGATLNATGDIIMDAESVDDVGKVGNINAVLDTQFTDVITAVINGEPSAILPTNKDVFKPTTTLTAGGNIDLLGRVNVVNGLRGNVVVDAGGDVNLQGNLSMVSGNASVTGKTININTDEAEKYKMYVDSSELSILPDFAILDKIGGAIEGVAMNAAVVAGGANLTSEGVDDKGNGITIGGTVGLLMNTPVADAIKELNPLNPGKETSEYKIALSLLQKGEATSLTAKEGNILVGSQFNLVHGGGFTNVAGENAFTLTAEKGNINVEGTANVVSGNVVVTAGGGKDAEGNIIKGNITMTGEVLSDGMAKAANGLVGSLVGGMNIPGVDKLTSTGILDKLVNKGSVNMVTGGAMLDATGDIIMTGKSVDDVGKIGNINAVIDTEIVDVLEAKDGNFDSLVHGGGHMTTLQAAGNIKLEGRVNMVNGTYVTLNAGKDVDLNGNLSMISGGAKVTANNIKLNDDETGKHQMYFDSEELGALLPAGSSITELLDKTGITNSLGTTGVNGAIVAGGAQLKAEALETESGEKIGGDITTGGTVSLLVNTPLSEVMKELEIYAQSPYKDETWMVDQLLRKGTATTVQADGNINLASRLNMLHGGNMGKADAALQLTAGNDIKMSGTLNMVSGNVTMKADSINMTGEALKYNLGDGLAGMQGAEVLDKLATYGSANVVLGGATLTATGEEGITMKGLANAVLDVELVDATEAFMKRPDMSSLMQGGAYETTLYATTGDINLLGRFNVVNGGKVSLIADKGDVNVNGGVSFIGGGATVTANNIKLNDDETGKYQMYFDSEELGAILPAGSPITEMLNTFGITDLLGNTGVNGAIVAGGANLQASSDITTGGTVSMLVNTPLSGVLEELGNLAEHKQETWMVYQLLQKGTATTVHADGNINLASRLNVLHGGNFGKDGANALSLTAGKDIKMNGSANVVSGNVIVDAKNDIIMKGEPLKFDMESGVEMLDKLAAKGSTNIVTGGATLNAKGNIKLDSMANFVLDTEATDLVETFMERNLDAVAQGGNHMTTLKADGNIDLVGRMNVVNGAYVTLEAGQAVNIQGTANMVSGNAKVTGASINITGNNNVGIDWSELTGLLPDKYAGYGKLAGDMGILDKMEGGVNGSLIAGGATLTATSGDITMKGMVSAVVDTTLANVLEAVQTMNGTPIMEGGAEDTSLIAKQGNINLESRLNFVNGGQVTLDAGQNVNMNGTFNTVSGNATVKAGANIEMNAQNKVGVDITPVLNGHYADIATELGMADMLKNGVSSNIVAGGANLQAEGDVVMSGDATAIVDTTASNVIGAVKGENLGELMKGGRDQTQVIAKNGNIELKSQMNLVNGGNSTNAGGVLLQAENGNVVVGGQISVVNRADIKAGNEVKFNSRNTVVKYSDLTAGKVAFTGKTAEITDVTFNNASVEVLGTQLVNTLRSEVAMSNLNVADMGSIENLGTLSLKDAALSGATLYNAGSIIVSDKLTLDSATLSFVANEKNVTLNHTAIVLGDGFQTLVDRSGDMLAGLHFELNYGALDFIADDSNVFEFRLDIFENITKELTLDLAADLADGEFSITLTNGFRVDDYTNVKIEWDEDKNVAYVTGTASVPEPTTATLSLLALAALAARRRRK